MTSPTACGVPDETGKPQREGVQHRIEIQAQACAIEKRYKPRNLIP